MTAGVTPTPKTSGAHSKSAQKLSHSLLLPLAQRRLPAIEVGTATSMMLMVRHNARGSRGPRRATGESTGETPAASGAVLLAAWDCFNNVL